MSEKRGRSNRRRGANGSRWLPFVSRHRSFGIVRRFRLCNQKDVFAATSLAMKIHSMILIFVADFAIASTTNYLKNVHQNYDDDPTMIPEFRTKTDDPKKPKRSSSSWDILTPIIFNNHNFADDFISWRSGHKSSDTMDFPSSTKKNTSSKINGRSLPMGCRERPSTDKEYFMGSAFFELCDYFGPRARDEMVSGLADEVVLRALEDVGERDGSYDSERAYAMAFQMQKRALSGCFGIAYDYRRHHYDDRNDHHYYCYPNDSGDDGSPCAYTRYPACLRSLAINPRPDLQVTWLKNYPRVLKYFDGFMEIGRSLRHVGSVFRELLRRRLMDRWTRLEGFEWAKSKILAQMSSRGWKGVETLGDVSEETPRLRDVCKFEDTSSNRFWGFGSIDCLRKIVGNIFVVEKIARDGGGTLEMEFFGGDAGILNLFYGVKKVLDEEKFADGSRGSDEGQMRLKSLIERFGPSMSDDEVLDDDFSIHRSGEASTNENLTRKLKKISNYVQNDSVGKIRSSGFPENHEKATSDLCRDDVSEIVKTESKLLNKGLSLRLMEFGDQFLTKLVALIGELLKKNNSSLDLVGNWRFRRSLTGKSKKNRTPGLLKPGELSVMMDDPLDEKIDDDVDEIAQNSEEQDSTTPDSASSTADGRKGSHNDREKIARSVASVFDVRSLAKTINRAMHDDSDVTDDDRRRFTD